MTGLSACAAQPGREEDGILADFAPQRGPAGATSSAASGRPHTAGRRLDQAPAGPDSAVCRICRPPLPDSHHHVPDARDRAVRCSCRPGAAPASPRAGNQGAGPRPLPGTMRRVPWSWFPGGPER
jgi:hypothetical protein